MCITQNFVFKVVSVCAETYAAFSACEERDGVPASEAHSTRPGGLRVLEGDWPRSFRRGKKNLFNELNDHNDTFKCEYFFPKQR